MKKVADLSAEETARLASEIWRYSGDRANGSKLLYCALCKDGKDARALQLLIERIDEFANDAVAIMLADYALAQLPAGDRAAKIEFLRLRKLFQLGLLKLKSGGDPSETDWQDASLFVLDEPGLEKLKTDLLGDLRDPLAVFEAARRLLGVESGLLRHFSLRPELSFQELLQADQFEPTPLYDEFLALAKINVDYQ